jgi:hypothetical protein
MKLKLIIVSVALLISVQSYAVPVLVHNANGTAMPLTITSTTSGNAGIFVLDISSSATGVTLSGGSAQGMTQVCTIAGANCSPLSNSIGTLSVWIVPNMSAGHTSVTKTGGGTINAVYFYEVSGLMTTNSVFDWFSFCVTTSGSTCVAGYTPSTANEFVVAAENCQGSTAAIGGSAWANTSFPNGEGGGAIITSSISLLTASLGSGCASPNNGGVIVAGFRASADSGTTCSSTPVEADVTEKASGTNPTASKTVTVHAVGNLLVMNGWCKNGCTPTASIGSETVTPTGTSGTSSASTGQIFQYYVLAVTAAGAKTLSLATAGGAIESQIAIHEFAPNPGCTYSHDMFSNPHPGQ